MPATFSGAPRKLWRSSINVMYVDLFFLSKSALFDLILCHVLCLSVSSAWLPQVVHGDLTTSNFMVRSTSGTEEVLAIDFGLASSQPLAEDKVGTEKPGGGAASMVPKTVAFSPSLSTTIPCQSPVR